MLSLRLQAIAFFVPENSNVIDIGCDHALLDIFLAKYKNCTCIASDINENCLNKAIKNINQYQLNTKIKPMVSNGLDDINYSESDYIIIAGMGFQTIKKILKNHYPAKMIIQSNTEVEALRIELSKKYRIKNEKTVFEKGKYYVVMYLEKGKQKSTLIDYLVGKNNDKEYVEYLFNKYLKIYNRIPKKYLFKRFTTLKKIIALKRYLKKH